MNKEPDFDKTAYILDGLVLLSAALILSLFLYKC